MKSQKRWRSLPAFAQTCCSAACRCSRRSPTGAVVGAGVGRRRLVAVAVAAGVGGVRPAVQALEPVLTVAERDALAWLLLTLRQFWKYERRT